MAGKDPGFKKDQVLVIPLNSTANKNYETIKQSLLQTQPLRG
jgi:hypothetical protein